MDVYDAVTSRRAVRGFTSQEVPRTILWRVLAAAGRAPSGGNLQPWNIYVLMGGALRELKRRASRRRAQGEPADEREFEMYPPDLGPLYRERRAAAAAQRYGALGIGQGEQRARSEAVAANWDCFGAPVALFCYLDRAMGAPQWADVGMYLQTVMLLLRAEGLHSCPQLAWSVYRATVEQIVSPPEGMVLFCGLSVGFADPAISHARIARAPIAETVTFLE